jgi:VWFA-related protein
MPMSPPARLPLTSRVFALALAAVTGSPILTAQSASPSQDPPVFRNATDLVSLDVRVIDKDGKPVTDLTQADFTITEDGAPQEITAFATQSFARQTPGPERPGPLRRVSGHAPANAQTRRIFLLVLGRAGMGQSVEGIRDGLNALVRFVTESIGPQDYVAVYGYNRLTDFTTDRDAILSVLDRYRQHSKRIETGLGMSEAGLRGIYGNGEPFPATQKLIDQVFASSPGLVVRRLAPLSGKEIAKLEERRRQMLDDMLLAALPSGDSFASQRLDLLRNELPDEVPVPGARPSSSRRREPFDDVLATTILKGMKDVGAAYSGLEALRPLEGEKHLILMSPGGITGLGEDGARDLGRAASDARVVVHVIHTGGLSSSSIGMASQSRTLAMLTGGRFDANKFPRAAMDLDRINEETSFAYLLGYQLPDGPPKARFREIRVTVNRPGVRVSHRHGYFWPAEFSGETIRKTLKYTRIGTAAEYYKEIDDIAFTATASAAKVPPLTARFHLLIDPARFSFEPTTSGRVMASVEIAVFCLDSKQRPVGDAWKTVELDLSDVRRNQLEKEGRLAVDIEVPLTARADSAKVVVYDYGADVLGSRNVKVPK